MIETVPSTLEKYYYCILVRVGNFSTLHGDNVLSESSPFDNTSDPYMLMSCLLHGEVGHEKYPRNCRGSKQALLKRVTGTNKWTDRSAKW